MSIRDEARQAQRRMPEEFWREMSGEQFFEEGFRQGAVWASEQAETFATRMTRRSDFELGRMHGRDEIRAEQADRIEREAGLK